MIPGQSPPGSTYNASGAGVEFHQGKAAFGDTYLDESGKWATNPRRFAEVGDIVMSIRAPVGPVNLVDRRIAIGRGLASIRINPGKLKAKWLFYHFRNIESELTGTQGSTFASINKGQIEDVRVPLAPLEQQARLLGELEERSQTIDKARQSAKRQIDAVDAMSAAYIRQVFPTEGERLPAGWIWVTLREVADVNPRRPSRLISTPDAPTTFIPMSAIDGASGRGSVVTERRFEEVRRGYTYFEERDVLFAKITPCMENGKHFIAEGLKGGFAFGTTELHVIRPKPGLMPDWIHYYVRQPSLLMSATYHFRGAVGQQRLPAEFISNLRIPVPPLPEQERIVADLREHLHTVEEAAQSAETQLDALDFLSRAYLNQAFSGGLS